MAQNNSYKRVNTPPAWSRHKRALITAIFQQAPKNLFGCLNAMNPDRGLALGRPALKPVTLGNSQLKTEAV